VADFLHWLGFPDPSQFVAQAVENHPDGVLVGQVLVRPALLPDQRLAHRLGRHPRAQKRRLELGVLLAVCIRQSPNILLQLNMFLFRLLVAAGGEVSQTNNPGPQLMQSQFDRVASPAEHAFGASRTAFQLIQSDLSLKGSSFRPSQLARGIFDGAHLLFRQLVHRPLLETSPDEESPQSQEGIQNQ